MSMTPRERWLALLEGGTPDRVPTDYRATREVTDRLLTELGCEDKDALGRRLHLDSPRTVAPTWEPIEHRSGSEVASDDATRPPPDMWGVRYRRIDYGRGTYDEPDFHPLAAAQDVADVHAHPWPDPEAFNYDTVRRQVEEDDGRRALVAGHYEPFLLYGYLRGLEQSFEDLALYPDIADAILGHLFDFYYERNRRVFEATAGKIDITIVADDLGSQTGPLMSLEMYRRFLRDHQRKMADLGRSFGAHVYYHTDGAARMFLPDLIDVVGIEVLDPIQWRCPGMERDALVRDFGRHVVFHGSIDNQQTLAFGSVDDVVEEVTDSLRIYRDARWICGPCHNIQPVSPTANIVAMYETIWEHGAG